MPFAISIKKLVKDIHFLSRDGNWTVHFCNVERKIHQQYFTNSQPAQYNVALYFARSKGRDEKNKRRREKNTWNLTPYHLLNIVRYHHATSKLVKYRSEWTYAGFCLVSCQPCSPSFASCLSTSCQIHLSTFEFCFFRSDYN